MILSSVVFPDPVPPEIKTFSRIAEITSRTRANSSVTLWNLMRFSSLSFSFLKGLS